MFVRHAALAATMMLACVSVSFCALARGDSLRYLKYLNADKFADGRALFGVHLFAIGCWACPCYPVRNEAEPD